MISCHFMISSKYRIDGSRIPLFFKLIILAIVILHASYMSHCRPKADVKGVQTFVAMVFLSPCTARRAHLLLASKLNFEQVYFRDLPRKVSVC